MLPMFGGAEKVFRKVLVPLAGLQELLMLRDAINVKRSMLKTLDPERAEKVSKVISKFFDGDESAAKDPLVLQKAVNEGWGSLKMPSFFGKKESSSDENNPSETTPLV